MKFILVDRTTLGYPVYPEIGTKAEATITDVKDQTPVYDSKEDAYETKIKFWNAVTGMSFTTEAVIPKNPSAALIAEMLGATEAQVKAQLKKNAAYLRTLIAKIESAGGKKVRGYSLNEVPLLRQTLAHYESQAS